MLILHSGQQRLCRSDSPRPHRSRLRPGSALRRCVVVVGLSLPIGAATGQEIDYGSIELVRDQWGIPHVFAQTDAGALYGLGYATAADRGFQMHYNLRMVQGRSAEVLGQVRKISGPDASAVDHDRRMRTYGFHHAARRVADNIDAPTRGLLEAYSRGVNDYFATHRDELPRLFAETGLTPEPWTPADCIASWWQVGQFFGTDGTRDLIAYRNLTSGTQQPNTIPPDDEAAVIQLTDVDPAWAERTRQYLVDRGFDPADNAGKFLPANGPSFSHAWVVGGDRSTTGSTVLVSDPQTPVTNPSLFYEFHISGESFDARGIGVPGSPVVLIGFTRDMAWGVTALGADQADLFRLRTDEGHPDQYFLDGEWRDMGLRSETIHVKGGRDIRLIVRETHFGPVVTEYAFTQAGEPEVAQRRIPVWETNRETIQGAMAMLRARDVEAFDRALEGWRFPSINILFGDRTGRIGYRTAYALPLRSPHAPWGGSAAQDGTETRFDWAEIVPHDLLPHVIDPERGLLFSANHRPIASFYPIPLGTSTGGGGHTVRSWRLQELMARRAEAFSPQDVYDIHFDSVNPSLRDIVRLGLHLRDVQQASLSAPTTQALEHLEGWSATGASSDLSHTGAEVATRIPTNFRAGNTELANRVGGGQGGLVSYLRGATQRLDRDSATELDEVELAFVDQAIAAAWSNAARAFGRDPAQWAEVARSRVGEMALVYFKGLHGFPPLDPMHDLSMPSLTTIDGNTIKSQVSQSYTQFVQLDDPDRSLSILPIGQSEGADSRWRTSTMELWARGELHPAPLSRPAVDNIAVSSEALTPRASDTAIEEDADGVLPLELVVHQNYPNPFNGGTVIRYELPAAGEVTLSIYASSGQLVRAYRQAHDSAGSYSIAWDGRNADGRQVASGVYLYRMLSAAVTVERKMELLR